MIGFDNHIWTTFWGQHSAHPGIALHAIVDGVRFIEVSGTGFTVNERVKLGYDITAGGAPSTDQTGEDTFTSDGAGNFVHHIRVNLAGDISAVQAQVTDVASDAIATASI